VSFLWMMGVADAFLPGIPTPIFRRQYLDTPLTFLAPDSLRRVKVSEQTKRLLGGAREEVVRHFSLLPGRWAQVSAWHQAASVRQTSLGRVMMAETSERELHTAPFRAISPSAILCPSASPPSRTYSHCRW